MPRDNPPQPRQVPNRIVKIVLEEVDTDETDVKACRIYPEYEGRQLTLGTLMMEDRTLAETWSIELLEFIRAQLLAKAGDDNGVVIEAPKKEDMN